MKLQARFVQLPIQYDADRLAAEVLALGEEPWLPHPQRFEGNDFLPLLSANGEPANESFAGQMAPTPYLEKCPYLIEVLASFGASLGRTRLMRLSGGAEVTPHFDINYYWRDRMRVHVPIVTQPSVQFHCGGLQVNMAPGECWIFDTWSRHRVINDAERKRIHLVADTVGGEGFWDLALAGRLPEQPNPTWKTRKFEGNGAKLSDLDLEGQNVPAVMTPWEARAHIDFLFSEAQQSHPSFPAIAQAAAQFTHIWRGLWSTFGEREEGWPRYRKALDQFDAQMRALGASQVKLRNGADLYMTLTTLVIASGLGEVSRNDNSGEMRVDVGSAPTISRPSVQASDPRFDRPVFIVNSPRSGSSLLFETLAQAPNVFTVGGESHGVIEGVRGLGVMARNFESNVLTAEQAQPDVVAELRERFSQMLRDRDGRPAPMGRVRMLEKTPKNSLRISFLAEAFPEARFIYLYRDPRQTLSSMMEGWESGRFQTYTNLPGWQGERPWSFLLTPGWRDLAPLPLERIVAAQWATATQIMLDDLQALPAGRWTVARYDALKADPNAEIARLCAAVGFDWDRRLEGELPIARHTVSKPDDDKWRARAGEIEAVLPGIAAVAERAARIAAR